LTPPVFLLFWLWLEPNTGMTSMRDQDGPKYHDTRESCDHEARYRDPPPLLHGEPPVGHLCETTAREWVMPR
jgi:hypothetical protein